MTNAPEPNADAGHPISSLTRIWYDTNQRELPWRGEHATPWRVMVSEFMLQQTPVARVVPVFESWLDRWPTPAALAAEPQGEAVRMWGKLGYPRRAMRLHAAANAITDEHGGVVPDNAAALRSLPGVGEYTAAAIAAFAYQARIAVVDTNVRRVVHRAILGAADAGQSTTKADVALVESLLPADPDTAATVSIAFMELGALVCTAKSPVCPACPLLEECAWILAGRPAYDGPAKRAQSYAGTDRQVRGRLLDVLRDNPYPVMKADLDLVWQLDEQRERALVSLLDDGLAVQTADGLYALA